MKQSQQKAQACIIWMHGLGADASDMVGLSEQLKVHDKSIRHVFMDAPVRPVTLNAGMIMPAWYDILGTALVDREDKEGIEQSNLLIREVMDSIVAEGFEYSQIFLAGFSQGGAMALYTGLHTPTRLGGLIALSAYLPLATLSKPVLDKNTPFFIASGQLDPLVLPLMTMKTREYLEAYGYNHISYHQYPMGHSVCFEELEDLSLWLNSQIKEL